MYEMFTLPIGLIHSALDPACFRFHFSLPPPQFCMSGVMLGSAGCPSPCITSRPWIFLFHRAGQCRKRDTEAFSREATLEARKQRNGGQISSVQFYNLGQFAALLSSVRCLSVPLCFSVSLSFSASPSPSLSPSASPSADLSRFRTAIYKDGGKEYVRDNTYY